jgi:proteasome assembly chaperone (PAC2) family protein
MSITENLKIHARPKLKEPLMLAAWPGISNVAMITASYLARKLEVKELAEIRPQNFFEPVGVLVKNSIVENPQFPKSYFYYWKNPKGKDLIIFIGEAQPNSNSYSLANCILDTAEHYKVGRIYTCAAAITRIHHTEQPRVWAVGTNNTLSQEMAKLGLVQGGNLQIAGMNGLLLGVAKERKIEGICLLGEVPGYAARIQNPVAALAIMQVLSKLLDIKINLEELEQIAAESREQMKQIAAEAMEEYIDYFTEPIWEREEDEPDEE